MEDDHVDLENNTDIHEIAWQLMNREPGMNAKVMMGGGEKTMRMREDSSQTKDDDYSDDYGNYHCYTEDKYDFQYFRTKVIDYMKVALPIDGQIYSFQRLCRGIQKCF